MKVYIFGIGEGKKYLDRCLLHEIDICGYIDNYKVGEVGSIDGKPVIKQQSLREDYDYIIITLMQYEEVRNSLYNDGVCSQKIISFFDIKDASNEEYWYVIDSYKWRIELMWKHYTNIGIPFIDNMTYEIYAESEEIKGNIPKIISAEETVKILQKDKKCLARFGDGEFEILCGRPRPIFQDVNENLACRLREALNSRENNLLIAIADNYGSLKKYTDEAARDIRMYMTKEVRASHMKLLDLDRQYYDTYISRPYIIYRDKEHAKERFDMVKEIWSGEDILIIEGEHTRFGVGNDLLKNTNSVQRILAPDKNAFSKYEEIKSAAEKYGENRLILTILGPTATVLSYDLAKEKFWIIDIGQLDVEYEWFLCNADKKCGLKYKNVSEVNKSQQKEWDILDENLKQYFEEIVLEII